MSEYSRFNVTDDAYKSVGGHDIELSILTVKDLEPGRHPVIVRFHGGFLINGARLHEEWFPEWVRELAIQKRAILISADYRLLPEARGKDILDDLRDLYSWLRAELPFTLSTLGIEADLTRVLVCGESAGGYLAVQSALLFPNAGICAVISAYGVLDIKTPHFTESYEKVINGMPMQRKELIDEQLEDVKQGKQPKILSSAKPPSRLELAISAVQHGRYVEILGEESELYPMENLEKQRDESQSEVPPMWLFHGSEDTAVPVDSSKAFAEKLKTLHPNTDLLLTIEEGEEHGFDAEVGLDAKWVKDGLDFVFKYWP